MTNFQWKYNTKIMIATQMYREHILSIKGERTGRNKTGEKRRKNPFRPV